jgi:hypothetical protein
MSRFDCAEMPISKRGHFAAEAPSTISDNNARQGPTGHRVLYVLGFGIAGAIFENTIVFIYFALFYASG